MEKIMFINEQINAIVWGKAMLVILLLIGLFIMVRIRFLPICHFMLIIKKTLGSLLHKKDHGDGVTPFQAVSTALAGTLGVGSVVGVTTALTLGGPGALFWMWISALIGMAIKYGEVVLAIYFRKRNPDSTFIGGPMMVLEHGCKMPFLAVLFSLLCIFASFGIGNLTPANTIANTVKEYSNISAIWIGVAISLFIAFVILGKSNKIMKVNEIMIPFVSILYIVACIYLLVLNAERIPAAIQDIFTSAFNMESALGGSGSYLMMRAIHYGVSRGVFSNEAGMGSAPIAHASVEHVHPVEQGFWGIFEVFFDTIVVCTITGLVVLSSGLLDSGLEGVALSVACFTQGFGEIGGIIFAISIIFFALPSITGWYYYASVCIRYLFHGSIMLRIYQLCFLLLLIVGACSQIDFAWEIADTLNGLMAIPNLISLLIMHKIVVKLTKEYMRDKN